MTESKDDIPRGSEGFILVLGFLGFVAIISLLEILGL